MSAFDAKRTLAVLSPRPLPVRWFTAIRCAPILSFGDSNAAAQSLAGVVNTVMSGAPITQLRDDIYLVDVIVRAADGRHEAAPMERR
jgi:hypothetical protein